MVDPDAPGDVPDWLTAIAIAMAIGILILVFTWIVVQLEPVMSDFIATESAEPTVVSDD